MHPLTEKYNKEVVPAMKKKFGYKNNMSVPKLVKVVLSTGTGAEKDDVRKESIGKSLTAIAGQKLVKNLARKSIATFKVREGMPIGYSVTLRGARMNDFLYKFLNVTLPRVRDFRGLDKKSIDSMGNISIGLKEHFVFPEVSDEDVRSAFGVSITIGTTAKNKEEAAEMFTLLGVPFKKQ